MLFEKSRGPEPSIHSHTGHRSIFLQVRRISAVAYHAQKLSARMPRPKVKRKIARRRALIGIGECQAAQERERAKIGERVARRKETQPVVSIKRMLSVHNDRGLWFGADDNVLLPEFQGRG